MATDSNVITKKKCYHASFKLKVVDFAEDNTNRGAGREFNVNEKMVREWRKQKEQLKDLPPDTQRLPISNTKKRTYSPSFKLKVVEFAEGGSNRGAGREFNVDEKMVREWKKQKDQLKALPPEKQKLGRSGLHPLVPDLEELLVVWIKEQEIRPTNVQIQAKALQLHNGKKEFKASRGWLEKFLHRHDLCREKGPVITLDGLESMATVVVDADVCPDQVNEVDTPDLGKVEETDTKKRRYDAEFKLKVIEFAEENSNRGAGREFNIDEKMVRQWRKLKEVLKLSPPDKHRLSKGCSQPLLASLVASQEPQSSTPMASEPSQLTPASQDSQNTSQDPSPEDSQKALPVTSEDSQTTMPVTSEDPSPETSQEQQSSSPVTGEQSQSSLPATSPKPPLPSPSPRKRTYDTAFKLKVVESAETTSNRGAGRVFKVDEKRVREWRKQKEQLMGLPPGKQRLGHSGCHPLLPELETAVAAWIRDQPIKPTNSQIQAKALELHGGSTGFKASRGWLEKFLNRHDLCRAKSELEPVELCGPEEDPASCQVAMDTVIAGVGQGMTEVDIRACLDLDKIRD